MASPGESKQGAAGGEATLAEICIVAAAEAWRGDGEVLASGMGVIPRIAAGLAALTFSPDLLLNDAECTLVREPVPVGPRGDYRLKVEGWLPFRKVFHLLWSGRRHAMTVPTQLGHQRSTDEPVGAGHQDVHRASRPAWPASRRERSRLTTCLGQGFPSRQRSILASACAVLLKRRGMSMAARR